MVSGLHSISSHVGAQIPVSPGHCSVLDAFTLVMVTQENLSCLVLSLLEVMLDDVASRSFVPAEFEVSCL